jgi:hypothetical protein
MSAMNDAKTAANSLALEVRQKAQRRQKQECRERYAVEDSDNEHEAQH